LAQITRVSRSRHREEQASNDVTGAGKTSQTRIEFPKLALQQRSKGWASVGRALSRSRYEESHAENSDDRGFNEGWIEFEGEFEGSVKGLTSLKTVLEGMVRDARKQAA
jgi:hypothetical protein